MFFTFQKLIIVIKSHFFFQDEVEKWKKINSDLIKEQSEWREEQLQYQTTLQAEVVEWEKKYDLLYLEFQSQGAKYDAVVQKNKQLILKIDGLQSNLMS